MGNKIYGEPTSLESKVPLQENAPERKRKNMPRSASPYSRQIKSAHSIRSPLGYLRITRRAVYSLRRLYLSLHHFLLPQARPILSSCASFNRIMHIYGLICRIFNASIVRYLSSFIIVSYSTHSIPSSNNLPAISV